MNALDALHNRVSINRLNAPAPAGDILLKIQKAAFRAADHGRMKPWRFLIIEGDGLNKLGDLFVKAIGENLSDPNKERLAAKPKRAPMIMVAIAKQIDHPKVPMSEQLLSAGAAVQNMLNAAFALQVGAMWRTGELAYNPIVEKGLGLTHDEKIVGFLYLGTPAREAHLPIELDPSDYFTSWPA